LLNSKLQLNAEAALKCVRSGFLCLRIIGAQKGATTMHYFENIHTLDDLKRAYHAWCKKLLT
jgi:hypothetical protein